MEALRCLIDSMIFDAIAAESGLLTLVDRLTSAGRLELLAAPVSIAQVAATPDEYHRRRLQDVRVLVVPPVEPDDPDTGVLLSALLSNPGVDEGDAEIAAAAAAQSVPLVTEDRSLRLAVAEHLPRLQLWSWSQDLRPAIEALGRGEPTARRR
jgi:predicted nucleic acid-binding protein